MGFLAGRMAKLRGQHDPECCFYFFDRISRGVDPDLDMGMIQAITGFTDTYASIVASSPALATEAGRQSTLQGIILSNALKWAIVAVPLALLAVLAKW
jgi:hypothetical protein